MGKNGHQGTWKGNTVEGGRGNLMALESNGGEAGLARGPAILEVCSTED